MAEKVDKVTSDTVRWTHRYGAGRRTIIV